MEVRACWESVLGIAGGWGEEDEDEEVVVVVVMGWIDWKRSGKRESVERLAAAAL